MQPDPGTTEPSDAESTQSVPSGTDAAVKSSNDNAPGPSETINEFHRKKLIERREEWRINTRLAVTTAIVVAIVLVLGSVSYFYNSNAAAETFRLQAQDAAAIDDASEASKWWSRYLMMVPDDDHAIVQVAFSADKAADQAEDKDKFRALISARRRLSKSLAELSEDSIEDQIEVRRRLIRRELQSGGFWYREAERQVVLLNASIDDAFAHKALALALHGQLQTKVYDDRSLLQMPTDNYWQWLASQNPGFALRRAVQLAPDDMDVVSAFLDTARSNPEFFVSKNDANGDPLPGQPGVSADVLEWQRLVGDTNQLVKQSFEQLNKMDSGRADLILYRYGMRGDGPNPARAQTKLLGAGQKAADRLSNSDSSATDTDESSDDNSDELVLTRHLPRAYWDYLCLQEAARLATTKGSGKLTADDSGDSDIAQRAQNLQLASDWYGMLMTVDVPNATTKMRETTYLFAGFQAELAGNADRAIEIWRQGLKDVSADNLELNGALTVRLANAAVSDAELADAEAAADAFKTAIDAESSRLLTSTVQELTQGQRNQIGRTIEMARWRYNVASAQLMIRRDGGTKMSAIAIARLNAALQSTATVRALEKARLATSLASLYGQQEVWDQAAEALSIACDLLPSDTVLHVSAGEAWAKAGNRQRADQHWRLAGNSASLVIRIRAAQARFNDLLKMPPGLRDFTGLRVSVDQLRTELDAAVAKAPESSESLDETATSLRILQLSMPPRGVPAEQHLASDQLAIFADELAAKKQDNVALQFYAAERLSATGMNGKAATRLTRLEELLGKDSTPFAIIKARLDDSNGKSKSAARRVLDQIKTHPDDSNQLARLASNYALAARDLELSYESLQKIPADRRMPHDLYRLHLQAKQLAGTSKDAAATKQLEQQASQWLADLKTLEESNTSDATGQQLSIGTFWRMIELQDNLVDLSKVVGQLDAKDRRSHPKFIAARRLLDKILALRPRWGQAISKQGILSEMLGQHELALTQLEAGIAAGDRSMRTRQMRLALLITLERNEEADQEMKRMAMSADFVLDPYSKQDIRSAFERGELMVALDAARESVAEKPDDANALVVFARVVSAAVQLDRNQASSGKAKAKLSTDQRNQLIDEARDAIVKATALATENQLALAGAALDIEFRHGTPESVDKAFKTIEASNLSEQERLILSARVLLSKGDIDGAIETLRRADRIKSTAATQLQLAKLYQVQGQSVDLVKSLRRAVKLQPENQKLKAELAKAIVVHQGDDVDWVEVEQLLKAGGNASDNDKLTHAMLLAAGGDKEQLLQALKLVRGLVSQQNTAAYQASSLQVSVLVKLAELTSADDSSSKDQETRQRYLDEARSICLRLANVPNPQSVDLFRYAAMLLKYGGDDDLQEVESISKQLAVMPSGMLQSLELGMIYNQRMGGDDKETLLWLQDWAKDAKPTQDRRLPGGVESAAGQSLLKLGLIDDSLKWHEKAYELNKDALSNYVLALSAAKQFPKAAEICAAHYKQYGDATSAMLLTEVLLAIDSNSTSPDYADILKDATKNHPRNAALLESTATLSMQNGQLQDAINFYQQCLAIDPLRIRALNNLAMVYSQVPGLVNDGIVPIDRALKLTNRNPELLDTKGTVLLKAGRNKEALEIFEEALQAKAEPRFLFHKILTLIALNQPEKARKHWDTLDLTTLNAKGLTAEERELLEKMKNDFDSITANQI